MSSFVRILRNSARFLRRDSVFSPLKEGQLTSRRGCMAPWTSLVTNRIPRTREKVDEVVESIKWDDKGWAAFGARYVGPRARSMQGFACREALSSTISSKIIYHGKTAGSSCRTGAKTSHYRSVYDYSEDKQDHGSKSPSATLDASKSTISDTKTESEEAKINTEPPATRISELRLKIGEEIKELSETGKKNEGKTSTRIVPEITGEVYDSVAEIGVIFILTLVLAALKLLNLLWGRIVWFARKCMKPDV